LHWLLHFSLSRLARFWAAGQKGVILGLLVAVLSPVIGALYEYYSVAYIPASLEIASTFSTRLRTQLRARSRVWFDLLNSSMGISRFPASAKP
jgi:hypothetical protein